jgi:hypothetical protein
MARRGEYAENSFSLCLVPRRSSPSPRQKSLNLSRNVGHYYSPVHQQGPILLTSPHFPVASPLFPANGRTPRSNLMASLEKPLANDNGPNLTSPERDGARHNRPTSAKSSGPRVYTCRCVKVMSQARNFVIVRGPRVQRVLAVAVSEDSLEHYLAYQRSKDRYRSLHPVVIRDLWYTLMAIQIQPRLKMISNVMSD